MVLSATRKGTQIADRVKAWRLTALARVFGAITHKECIELSNAFDRTAALFALEQEGS